MMMLRACGVLRSVLFVVAGVLICLKPSSASEIERGLRKGDALRLTVDAETVVRPVNRRVMGISFFNLWDYVPIYSRTSGEWILNEHATKAIEDLHVPFSRTYWLDPGQSGRVAWDLKGAIDRVAQMCQRFGIRQEDFVLELERQAYRQSTSPETWAGAVRYSKEKGYRFRLWEVCNEPYGLGGPRDDPWKPQDYVAHVKEVYKAVKAVRPDAQIGMAADLSPWNHFQATQTDNPMLGQLAGYYDFVCPHYYCHMKNVDQVPFERITFEGNAWVMSAYVRPMRVLLAKYNPGRKIEILDTEWGMHGYNSGGGRADDANRNANIAGTLHRAIRMIYYLNEGLVEGASQWGMLSPANAPGFGIVAINDDRRFLPYYLNYYLSRHVGDDVLSVSGTCPYYEKAGVKFDYKPERYDISFPKVPVLVTKSADGKRLYLVAANGTASEGFPCRVDLKGFRAQTTAGRRLFQSSIDAPALVERESDVMTPFPVTVLADGQSIEFPCAPHSVSFVTLFGTTLRGAAAEEASAGPSPPSVEVALARIEAQVTTLQRAVERAKKLGIDTSYEETTLRTAELFSGWIRWDAAHPTDIQAAASKFTRLPPKRRTELAATWAQREADECAAILSDAIKEIDAVIARPALRRPVPQYLGKSLELVDGYTMLDKTPVFLGGYIFMPENEANFRAYGGHCTPIALNLNSLDESLKVAQGAVDGIRQRIAETERVGGVWNVFMSTGAPRWARSRYPDAVQGAHVGCGYDIDNPAVRQWWERLLAATGPALAGSRLGENLYSLHNEPMWWSGKGEWDAQPVTKYTLAKFRTWLAARHGKIETLNTLWGTRFSSFDQVTVEVPIDFKSRGSAIWLDWCRFHMDRITDWFTFLRTTIRKHHPQARVTCKLSPFPFLTVEGNPQDAHPTHGVDFEAITELLDVPGMDGDMEPANEVRYGADGKNRYALSYPLVAMTYDLMKSVAPKKAVFNSEEHSLTSGSFVKVDMTPEDVRAVLWLEHLHGMTMNLMWRWGRNEEGAPRFSWLGDIETESIGCSCTHPRRMDAYGRVMKEINAYGPEVRALADQPRSVRLYYSLDSYIQDPGHVPAVRRAYESLYSLGVPLGFVTERMLARATSADVKQYRVIVVAGAAYLSDAAVKDLRRYAAEGGRVVFLGSGSLAKDAYGRPRGDLTIKNAVQVPCTATTTPEELTPQLEAIVEKAGALRTFVCSDATSSDRSSAFGVFLRSARIDGADIVYLLNLNPTDKKVRLLRKGAPVTQCQDLFHANDPVETAAITLKPLEARLLRAVDQ